MKTNPVMKVRRARIMKKGADTILDIVPKKRGRDSHTILRFKTRQAATFFLRKNCKVVAAYC
jgi:hypothetical protein